MSYLDNQRDGSESTECAFKHRGGELPNITQRPGETGEEYYQRVHDVYEQQLKIHMTPGNEVGAKADSVRRALLTGLMTVDEPCTYGDALHIVFDRGNAREQFRELEPVLAFEYDLFFEFLDDKRGVVIKDLHQTRRYTSTPSLYLRDAVNNIKKFLKTLRHW